MRQPRAPWRAAVAAMFLVAQVSAVTTPVLSHAQTSTTAKPKAPASGRPPVDEGQSYYEQSRFDEAITLLKDLVDRGALQGAELQRAQEILARSYVKKGYPVQGKEMFKTMLRADPTYRPDPIRVPPDEARVFEEALKEYESEKAVAAPPTSTTPTTPATGTAPSPEKIGVASSASGKKGLTSQWWFWAGGALLIGGIAAAAMGGGGGDDAPPADNTLETFPSTP